MSRTTETAPGAARAVRWALGFGLLGVLILGAWLGLRRPEAEPPQVPRSPPLLATPPLPAPGARPPEPRREVSQDGPSSVEPPAQGDPWLLLGEREVLSVLRDNLASAPERVIAVATALNSRKPSSPDAPERSWMIVKGLDGLGRHHEARDKAREMVRSYPDSVWTDDVRRHVLVYPLGQPSREEMQAGAVPRPESP